jgi:hypothetical protein
MEPEVVRAVAAAWDRPIEDAGVAGVAAVLDDVLQAVARFREVDLEGIAPHVAAREGWD